MKRRGGGAGKKYSTSKVSCPVRLADGPKPRSVPSLENSPRALQPPASRVAEHRCPPTPGCGERPGAATWRAPGDGSCALFPPARVSHRPPRAQSWAHTRAVAAANFTAGAATEAAAASSSSSSSASAAATPRPPPPPPASAQSPPPPLANLVSGSRRRAAIGRRNAPRHNGAGRRRRARQRWGFPLSPQQPSAEKVPARGGRRRARSGAGRTRRGARAPGAGVAQVGRSGAPPAPGGGAEPTPPVEAEDGVRGRSRWGWPSRCGYLPAPHLRAGPAGRWRGRR